MIKMLYLPVLAPVLAFALQISGASAALLDWSYTGPGINNGSGTMEATLDTNPSDPQYGYYNVTSIAGTAEGQTITGLSSYDDPSNVLYPPSPPNIGVDTLGISFTVADGTAFNLYEDDGNYDPVTTPGYACGVVYCLLGPGDPVTGGYGDPLTALDSFTVTVAGVPEPSTWAMMLLGFAGLGFAGYHRSRKTLAPPVSA